MARTSGATMKSFQLVPVDFKGEFPVTAETTRNHIFLTGISQAILAAMVLAPNFYCKNCLRVISGMRGNPPLKWFKSRETEYRSASNFDFMKDIVDSIM